MNRLLVIATCCLLLLECRSCLGCVICSETRQDIAHVQVAELGFALGLFKQSAGRFPTTRETLQALVEDPGIPGWAGPYVKKRHIPNDPWGRPYRYRSPGIHGEYDLWSWGADGKAGGEREDRDVTSWPGRAPKTTRSESFAPSAQSRQERRMVGDH